MALSLLSPGTAQVFVKLHDGPLREERTRVVRGKYSIVRGDRRHRYYCPTPMRLLKNGIQ